MSWWIYLEDAEGIQYEALNVTYNYSEVTRIVGFHFRNTLDTRDIGDTIEELRYARDRLGTKRYYSDPYAPTPGNAGHAINVLVGWAEKYPPRCVWRVS